MKMIDVFGYNYKMTYGIYTDARVDGMAMPANMGFGMLFTNEEAPKAVCHAVNNHDRLTEENARLRGFVKKVAELDIETFHFETRDGDADYIEYICTDIVDDANELLSEFGGE